MNFPEQLEILKRMNSNEDESNYDSERRNSVLYQKRMTSVVVSPLALNNQIDGGPDEHHNYNCEQKKLVVVMVGLPARGKTYISKKMTRYFNWIGVYTRVFNVGDYRRNLCKYSVHNFFDPKNKQSKRIRETAAEEALSDMLNWLKEVHAEIGVFDATNTTKARRAVILERCQKEGFDVVFLESVCDYPDVITANILDVEVDSPDYVGMTKEEAVEDFKNRIKHYEDEYEPLCDDADRHLSYIRIFNQGERYLVNKVNENLQSRIVYYLMNIRPVKRTIYLTRHGESELNVMGRIGGDSNLSEHGKDYAAKLGQFMNDLDIPNLRVWTSHLKRTWQTAKHVKAKKVEQWRALNEIDAGVCEEMTYEEIQQEYPVQFAQRDNDKYNFRYESGESYQDLVGRLESVIMQLERQDNILVVCHQAVARCILAYFLDKSTDELPYLHIPFHTVMKLTPTAYQCIVEEIPLNVDAVDTHREKPQNLDVNRSSIEALQTVPQHF